MLSLKDKEMDPQSWVYSHIYHSFKHLETGKIVDRKTWETHFYPVDVSNNCLHEWQDITLVTSKVYNCKKCNMPKENFIDIKDSVEVSNNCLDKLENILTAF